MKDTDNYLAQLRSDIIRIATGLEQQAKEIKEEAINTAVFNPLGELQSNAFNLDRAIIIYEATKRAYKKMNEATK